MFIPAILQLATVCFIFSLLLKAVLAVVVIQTPLNALGSKLGVVIVIGGVIVVFEVVPFEHPFKNISVINKLNKSVRFKSKFLFISFKMFNAPFYIIKGW